MENWKPVKGYESYYKVSDKGNVFSLSKNKIMKKIIDKDGYEVISLLGKTKRVHRLVGEAFIDNCKNLPQINHKNGIKNDNNVNNLEWCDGFYNMKHRFVVLKQIPHNKGKKMSEKSKNKLRSAIKKNIQNGVYDFFKKKVKCVETGKIFESAKDACLYLGISVKSNSVSRAANGTVKTCKGFHWEYI